MRPSAYVLIATSNVQRAAAFRQAVSDAVGSDVVVVRDGEEALQQMAQRGWPALLLVDLSLPKVDGFAVLRRVRRQASPTETCVMVVAAHEPLRVAARELASTLAISQILPIDVERSVLREMVSEELASMRRPSAESPAAAFNAPLRDSPATDCSDVMDRAVIELRRKFKVPVCVGYLRNGEQENITLHVAARGPDAPVAISDPAELKFLRQVADTSEPLVVPNIEHHPVFGQLLTKGARPLRGFAAVPVMTSRDGTTGALCVFDTKPLTLNAADIDSLAALGRVVGQELDCLAAGAPEQKAPVADVNVEDVKALQHLAATDPLTGLANRRGGEKHISNEISRAKREKRPLSCILLDIDRFKQVNDTFGHQAGDQLLRDISLLLRRTLRAYDVLVRWGGEEFLIVLPGVDLEAARGLAERVRVAVEGMDTHGIGPVTLSAGAARFENDYDFAATLKAADRRLYQAKASGRNRVV